MEDLELLVKKDLHFIGFLVNVDDSILKLRIGDGFSIDKKPQEEVMPFLQGLNSHYGVQSGFDILHFDPSGGPSGCYCLTNCFPEFIESTPQGGIVVPIAKLKEIRQPLINKLRLLRLFKEGNILMQFLLFYHLEESIPSVAQIGSEYPLIDRTVFQLSDDEYTQAETFIKDTKIPFQQTFLQLAFDSFEVSYETHNRSLAFMSLMISMEALFGGGSELKYRISRNAAVLLGKNEDESNKMFDDMKSLYDKRSGIAHGRQGRRITPEDVLGLRYYVRESIQSIYKLDLDREALLSVLNKSGFGQSPLSK